MKEYTVKVYTNCEWDASVDAVHIQVDDNTIAAVKKAQAFLSDNREMFSVVIEAPDFEFGGYEDGVGEEIQEGFIPFDSEPDQIIRYGTWKVTTYSVKYVAFGKYSGDEFFTDNISELFK
jgi:hypothetical protein